MHNGIMLDFSRLLQDRLPLPAIWSSARIDWASISRGHTTWSRSAILEDGALYFFVMRWKSIDSMPPKEEACEVCS